MDYYNEGKIEFGSTWKGIPAISPLYNSKNLFTGFCSLNILACSSFFIILALKNILLPFYNTQNILICIKWKYAYKSRKIKFEQVFG